MSNAAATARLRERAPNSQTRIKARRPTSKERSSVVAVQALWDHASRIGGDLTPQRISQIIREADAGDTRRLIDLANECKQRDTHLFAVLATHEESIAACKWQISAPISGKGKDKAKPKAKDARAAQWVEDRLREVFGFQRLVAGLAGAVYFSFDYQEIIWEKKEGKLVPKRFVPIAPRRFRFRQEDGVHVLWDDGKTAIDLHASYPNKFVSSFPRVTGDVAPREGLMRALTWLSVMRSWVVMDWLKTGEVSWKPWRIATFSKEKGGRADRKDIEAVMRRMTTDLTAVIPDSSKIQIEWPGGTGSRTSTHAELFKALGDEMSKAVLGQTETTQSSSSSGYAQAKIHNLVRKDLMEARAKQVAEDLTRYVVEPMVRLNFGSTVAVPRFEFLTQDEIDLKAFADALKTLKDAGFPIPQEWVSDQTGIPQRKKGEPILGEPDANAPEPEEGEDPSAPKDPNQPDKPEPAEPADPAEPPEDG